MGEKLKSSKEESGREGARKHLKYLEGKIAQLPTHHQSTQQL
jgi:hypothetical protein